jgi:hypothetical protein
MKQKLLFDKHIDIRGTCLKDYLQHPYSFTEVVARLFSIVNYNIFENNRSDATFEIRGKFKKQIFTIYDRSDNLIHIGGSVNLDVILLQTELLKLLHQAHQVQQSKHRLSNQYTNFFNCWKFLEHFIPICNI